MQIHTVDLTRCLAPGVLLGALDLVERDGFEQYDIGYTVLLAGEPDHLEEKVPQAVNLNAFPTTFILGRDGHVRAAHTGFPSPGSGAFYTQAERDITEQIERLLGERAPATF